MGEKRLLEITSTINQLDSVMQVMGYLSALSESEVYLFISCIRGSSFSDLNLYDAIIAFSRKYVGNKTATADMEFLKNFQNAAPSVVRETRETGESYLENFLMGDFVSVGHSYSRKRG